MLRVSLALLMPYGPRILKGSNWDHTGIPQTYLGHTKLHTPYDPRILKGSNWDHTGIPPTSLEHYLATDTA